MPEIDVAVEETTAVGLYEAPVDDGKTELTPPVDDAYTIAPAVELSPLLVLFVPSSCVNVVCSHTAGLLSEKNPSAQFQIGAATHADMIPQSPSHGFCTTPLLHCVR